MEEADQKADMEEYEKKREEGRKKNPLGNVQFDPNDPKVPTHANLRTTTRNHPFSA